MGWGVRDYPTPPPEPPVPVCPVCGEECERIYLSTNSEVIGCDRCLLELDAYEWVNDRMESEGYDDW